MGRRSRQKSIELSHLLLIVLAIIGIIVVIVIVSNSNKNNNVETEEEKYYIDLAENYRQNTSSKFSESRKVGDLEVIGAGISYLDGRSTFSLNLCNNTNDAVDTMKIRVSLLNKNGQTLKVLIAYVSALEPGEETQINIIDESDITNAYDYKVEVE